MRKIREDSAQGLGQGRRIGFFNNLNSDRDFKLFLIAGMFAGIGSGINSSIFNNYLSDVYKLSENLRGFLEVPREAPGLCIMFVLAVLSFLRQALQRPEELDELAEAPPQRGHFFSRISIL